MLNTRLWLRVPGHCQSASLPKQINGYYYLGPKSKKRQDAASTTHTLRETLLTLLRGWDPGRDSRLEGHGVREAVREDVHYLRVKARYDAKGEDGREGDDAVAVSFRPRICEVYKTHSKVARGNGRYDLALG